MCNCCRVGQMDLGMVWMMIEIGTTCGGKVDARDDRGRKAPNNTTYKRWSCHGCYKLLCKLYRNLPPPAMGTRFSVFGKTDKQTQDWRLQMTQPTSGGAVTVVSSCCANCVEPPRPQQWGPDLPFLGMPATRTRWMAGAAAHKSG